MMSSGSRCLQKASNGQGPLALTGGTQATIAFPYQMS